MTFSISSDQHCHDWSQFSTTLKSGENSRLRIILDELERQADEVLKAGGSTMILAGDLFHVRGSVDPEVLNPTIATIKRIVEIGVSVALIPGNHDLKGRDTTELGNAMQVLGEIEGVTVATKPTRIRIDDSEIALFPWRASTADLLDDMRQMIGTIITMGEDPHDVDAVIHAPVNEVFPAMPGHGLAAADLASIGFRRVFSGHYHHHKIMEDGKVFSIGATTHQTFSDVESKAGFLLVDDETVTYRSTQAPFFVDIDDKTSEDDFIGLANGNYVRVRGFVFDVAGEKAMRDELKKLGALGVVFHTQRVTASSRPTSSAVKIGSLETSVSAYVDSIEKDLDPVVDKMRVQKRAGEVLAEARSVAA